MGNDVSQLVRRFAVAGLSVSLLVGGVVLSGQLGVLASASGQTNRATVYPTSAPPPVTSAPTLVVTGATSPSVTTAAFTGSANPGALPTTAFFQYGLDPKYTGGGPVVYTGSTPILTLGSDASSHSVSASVTGLVPDALYHVRLVATNTSGTTLGPDTTFTTLPAPPPNPPTVGQTVNIAPVSGFVLIKVNGQFVPLTQLRQIPQNVVIDALHGALLLITGTGGGKGAGDAAASRVTNGKTQRGTFGGAIFKLTQAHSGLARLTLVEGAYNGAPTYATCRGKAPDATAAAVSRQTLQLLQASAKGKFSTRGRYGAATIRGTKWTIADRCDGTLTHDISDSLVVTDFVHHKTIVLHAGQSYLATARTRR